jgi:predicted HicB family RNase H-like nuclease
MTKKSRSGTKWSEADYAAAGWSRVNVRVPSSVADILRAEAERRGVSISALISEMAAGFKAKAEQPLRSKADFIKKSKKG